jgi:hypothetical protein
MENLQELLRGLKACPQARVWAGEKTIEQVVADCYRGDWLLWLAKEINIGLRPLSLARGHCAKTVLHLMQDDRSKKAVEVAISFGEGISILEDFQDAASDARAHYDSVFVSDAAYAASRSSFSDDAAGDASIAAGDAAFYAEHTAFAEAEAAVKESQLETANICREFIGEIIIKKVNFLLNN